jgi:hypothetical protein
MILRTVNIECLEDGLFDGPQSFSTVDLRENNISFIDSYLIYGLNNLKCLNLADNRIDRIPFNLLKNNNKIEVFTFSNIYQYQLFTQNTSERNTIDASFFSKQ